MEIILRCPIGGEEWPITSYKSVCDATKPLQRPGTIHLWCPAKHSFTLAKAIKVGMFTKEQAERIIAEANRLVKAYCVDLDS